MVKQSPASFAALRIPISNQRASAGNRIAGISPFELDAWCDYLAHRARLLGRRTAGSTGTSPTCTRSTSPARRACRLVATAGGAGPPLLAGLEDARHRQPDRRRTASSGTARTATTPTSGRCSRAATTASTATPTREARRRSRRRGAAGKMIWSSTYTGVGRHPRLQRRRAALRPAHVPALECARGHPGHALRPGADLVHAGRIRSTAVAANGESVLVYPGADGPVASARLEQIRDGIEDWDVLDVVRRKRGPPPCERSSGTPACSARPRRRVELACTVGCELHGSDTVLVAAVVARRRRPRRRSRRRTSRRCAPPRASRRRRPARPASAGRSPRTRPRGSRPPRPSPSRGRAGRPSQPR